MIKWKYTRFPETLSFVRVFSFNHLLLYTALHKRVLSTLKQCLLQFLTIIIIIIIIYFFVPTCISNIVVILD